jgi:hypothetical protein
VSYFDGVNDRLFSWLPEGERWRIGLVWRQRKFFGAWVSDYCWSYCREDFEQVLAEAVFISWDSRLSALETARLGSRSFHAFFREMGIRKQRGGKWVVAEDVGTMRDAFEDVRLAVVGGSLLLAMAVDEVKSASARVLAANALKSRKGVAA